ncbi:fructuronate reductase [Alteromonadaceae bacterium Bs31]|nr:fructuronate reductase [Alteromonadaceae bacterium Bs31]
MDRLSSASLQTLPSDLVRPRYDRSRLKPGIVHLGLGAFHRAHQAVFTERVIAELGGDWGIIGCSLRSGQVREQLALQDYLYSVVERDGDKESIQIHGPICDVLVGPENPTAVVSLLAQAHIKVVSVTVTEKGYCHDPASGALNLKHPDIQHDLQNLSSPKSLPGYLVAALKLRMEGGVQSFTALSCDNLPNNGKVLHKAVVQLAAAVDLKLAQWIEANTTFPCTMVDRIVPASTDADRDSVARALGVRDEAAVVAEPFIQWVIEDRFCNDRPAWERAGAILVDDVEIYEHMKLRLLNSSHSLLAYTGYLAGFEHISDVMAEPAFARMCETFMDREAGQTIDVPPGFDLNAYKCQLRERFANPGLKHRTWQIAMDGSQKIPPRFLVSLRDQLKGEGNIDIICLAIAAWIRYVSGIDEKGQVIDVKDPLAEPLRKICDSSRGDPLITTKSIIAIEEVFGKGLLEETHFLSTVAAYLTDFYRNGVFNTIQQKFSP